MSLWWKCAGTNVRRRQRMGGGLSLGDQVDHYETRTLLSAAAIVATVPEASKVSVEEKVSKAAKDPVDYAGTHNLSGSLGPGIANITQNGSAVTLTVTFYQYPELTNLPLEGTVKGKKLKANLSTVPYNGLTKVVFKAKLNGEDLSWRIKWDS